MTIHEEKSALEAAKFKLWKHFFKGRKNRKAMAEIEYINLQLKKINEVLFPRRPKVSEAN